MFSVRSFRSNRPEKQSSRGVLYGVQKIAPEENCPPVRVRVWLRISVRIRAGGGAIFIELVCTKAADLRPATLLKKRLWHRCFPMDFAKFLRSPFFYRTPTVAVSEVYFSSHQRNIVCETNHEVKTNIFPFFWCWKNLFFNVKLKLLRNKC